VVGEFFTQAGENNLFASLVYEEEKLIVSRFTLFLIFNYIYFKEGNKRAYQSRSRSPEQISMR
jgi:hypothetical protein